MQEYLQPTEFLDYDQTSVREFAEAHARGAKSDTERAVALYGAVRDGFQYNPYIIDLRRTGLRASNLLTRNRGYCVEKAVLLAARARAVGVPSRLSFYIVRNHIATERLERALRKNYLVFHGAADLRGVGSAATLRAPTVARSTGAEGRGGPSWLAVRGNH